MTPKYEIGQQVVVMPVKGQQLSPRDATIESYAGQTGEVADFYSLTLNRGEVFYIYTVQIGDDRKEVVLHEDELAPHMA